MNAAMRKPKVMGDVDQAIGQRLRVLRLQLGMSQDALGKEVNLTFQQIQKYEKGSNRLSVSRMLQFCEILQTTPNEIIGWKATTAAVNDLDSTLFQIARDFSMLPEELQITVRRICDELMRYVVVKKKRG